MPDWDRLVREQGPAVLRICSRILGVIADAEDLTQEVFCEAWQIQATQKVENWPGLHRRLAVLRSLDKLRGRRPMIPLELEQTAFDRESPVDVAIAHELADRLRLGLSRLSQRQAAVFSLFYFENHNRDEIAQILSVSHNAVSTALSKARSALKNHLSLKTEEAKHEPS